MKQHNCWTRRLLMMGFCLSFMMNFPVVTMGGELDKVGNALKKVKDLITGDKDKKQSKEIRWYSDYQKGKEAAKQADWTTAITLFKRALAQEPKAKTWRVKGVDEPIIYDPYVKLGEAYLATGDLEAAKQNCEIAQEKAISPKDEIDQCLAAVAKRPDKKQVAKAAPTPAPKPKSKPTIAPLPTPNPPIILQTKRTPTPAIAKTKPTPTPVVQAKQTPTPTATPEIVVETPVPELQKPGNVYAVIVGIGNFQDVRIPSLRFTVNDAQGLYQVLTDPNYGGILPDHVKLLLNQDATAQNVKSAIGTWLKQQAGEQDTAIIYYAGHGATEGQETYWVTYEANIDDLYATALSNNDVYGMLSRIQAKRVITFLDSCYSAATVNRQTRTRDAHIEIPWDKFTGEGRATISASNGEQLSLEMDAYEHGVFTYYLIEGLKGKADGAAGTERDGVIELDELWNFVKNHVTETARKLGNTQTPVFQGAMMDRIPIAYDIAYLKTLKQQRAQEKKTKQAKLQKLFEQKKISAAHFDCAYKMLEAGKSNGYLDGLLSGEISSETFKRLFTCNEE